jgi:uncharacterized membrane protein
MAIKQKDEKVKDSRSNDDYEMMKQKLHFWKVLCIAVIIFGVALIAYANYFGFSQGYTFALNLVHSHCYCSCSDLVVGEG